jgi:hypothetical protein
MEKEKTKVPRMIDVVCIRETASGTEHYEEGQRYSVPEDHPCMQYFKKV